MAKHVKGFLDFVREQGVVGLAIGLAVGTQAAILVKDIVAAIVDPIIGLIIGNSKGLQAAQWDVSLRGREASFALGQLVYSLIVFLAVCLVIYLIVHGLKLDKLDKKKNQFMAEVKKSDAQWREQLTEEQYRVLRGKGTEIPFSGKYVTSKDVGKYVCAACGAELFSSNKKYDSTTPGLVGWPSFSEALDKSAIELRPDDSLGMSRTEVICSTCGSHLGHLFEDETSPNGKHYCINSISLDFKPEKG